MIIRTYSELQTFSTFEERFDYLRLNGRVGEQTFGFDRYINQSFYTSYLWKKVRDEVIIRDNACDLGVFDREINNQILVHHINPMVPKDLIDEEEWVLNPEFLITTTKRTHNAIHYGDKSLLLTIPKARTQGDTKLW